MVWTLVIVTQPTSRQMKEELELRDLRVMWKSLSGKARAARSSGPSLPSCLTSSFLYCAQ